VQIASYIKNALSEACNPASVAALLCGSCPIMRVYVIGEARPGREKIW
jgi:hypothetical protein